MNRLTALCITIAFLAATATHAGLGTCCLEDGSCLENVAPPDCEQINGIPAAGCIDGRCYFTTGACCLPGGGCMRSTPVICATIGGTFAGFTTICPATCIDCRGDCFPTNGFPNNTKATPGNGRVNIDDLIFVINALHTQHPAADVFTDGVINTNDLIVVLQSFGLCEPG